MFGRVLATTLLLVSEPAFAAGGQSCAAVSTPEQKKDEATIKRLETAWLTAEFRGDVGYLECLLDPGYGVITASTGAKRTKADLLAQIAPNKDKPARDIPPLATTAIVNGSYATAFSSMTGKKANGESYEARFVDTYVFQNGRWRAVGGVDF